MSSEPVARRDRGLTCTAVTDHTGGKRRGHVRSCPGRAVNMELVIVVGLLNATRDAAVPAGTTPPKQDADNGRNHYYDTANDTARYGTCGR